jgi:hypothetical protein
LTPVFKANSDQIGFETRLSGEQYTAFVQQIRIS